MPRYRFRASRVYGVLLEDTARFLGDVSIEAPLDKLLCGLREIALGHVYREDVSEAVRQKQQLGEVDPQLSRRIDAHELIMDWTDLLNTARRLADIPLTNYEEILDRGLDRGVAATQA